MENNEAIKIDTKTEKKREKLIGKGRSPKKQEENEMKYKWKESEKRETKSEN